MPRTSVGNSSASIVPIESAAGAAGDDRDRHEDPEHGPLAEEEDHRCRACRRGGSRPRPGGGPALSAMRPASRMPNRPGSPAVTPRNAATPDDENPRSSDRNRFVNCADGALKMFVRNADRGRGARTGAGTRVHDLADPAPLHVSRRRPVRTDASRSGAERAPGSGGCVSAADDERDRARPRPEVGRGAGPTAIAKPAPAASAEHRDTAKARAPSGASSTTAMPPTTTTALTPPHDELRGGEDLDVRGDRVRPGWRCRRAEDQQQDDPPAPAVGERGGQSANSTPARVTARRDAERGFDTPKLFAIGIARSGRTAPSRTLRASRRARRPRSAPPASA